MSSTYFDAASACPLHPVAEQALEVAAVEGWADPGRRYTIARRARQLLDAARESVAETLKVRTDEVLFTANGTQAVHLGVIGALDANSRGGNTFVHSAIEHSCVRQTGLWHADRGGDTVTVPVDRMGHVDLEALRQRLREPGVALVAIQSANHEVGTQQNLETIAEICADVPLFVDAAQSIGRAPIPSGWSLLAGSARKWGGPAGVGVVVVRRGTRWRSPLPHEAGGLPGVAAGGAVAIPEIVAAAAALRAVAAEREAEDARLRALTARIRQEAARIPYMQVVGDPQHRLPHIVTFSYPYEDGEPLAAALDAAGFAVSAGSACTAATLRPSHVLEAMGVLSHGNIRVSLHRDTTESQVTAFLDTLPRVVAQLRDVGDVNL